MEGLPLCIVKAQRLRAQTLLAAVQRHPSFPIVLETYRQALSDVFDLALDANDNVIVADDHGIIRGDMKPPADQRIVQDVATERTDGPGAVGVR